MRATIRHITFFLLVPLTTQMAAAQDPAPPLPVPGRSMVVTEHGMVAASQPLAAQAAVQVLERGGNAMDAAIAANAAMGVMEPTGNGIGGDLFAIIYEAESGAVHGLNASGWSPAGLTPELLAERGINEMPYRGIHAVTVPGVVGGWAAIRDRFGTLPFSTLLAPAIHYAEHGFPVAEITAGLWSRSQRMLASDPSSAETFLIDAGTPAPGQIFRNPNLARTLTRIAEQGRAGFYQGATADSIVAASDARGGTMTPADLREYEAEWVEPISTTYRGWTVYEIPPNGQGIAALMMLNLMERFPLGEWGFHSPEAMHVMIEAKKLAYADMITYVADPRIADVPVDAMLDKPHGAERAERIRPDRATCSVEPSSFPGITDRPDGETIYLTVIDEAGNIVSLIQSNYAGFGSGIVPEGMGFMLQNRGALFTLEEGHPNVLAPRKRPLHTIIPAFMERGDVKIGFGIMGGWNQAQAHAQFVSNIVDHGLTIQQALEAGRFRHQAFDGCGVWLEALVPAATRSALVDLGHEVELVPRRSSTFGYGQAILSRGGIHWGASEPRHDGAAIPQPAPFFQEH
ncbi:MAG: gamma-glutamyltransferase [Longimicrobiales bacterium]